MKIAILSCNGGAIEKDAYEQFPDAEIEIIFQGTIDISILTFDSVRGRLLASAPDALIVRGPTELQVYASRATASEEFEDTKILVWRRGVYQELML